MHERKHTKLVHEGKYVAEVDIELIPRINFSLFPAAKAVTVMAIMINTTVKFCIFLISIPSFPLTYKKQNEL